MSNYNLVRKEIITEELSSLSKDMLRTLLYFSIFKYPMTCEEIYINSSEKDIILVDLEYELGKLYERGIIEKKDKYFYIGKDESLVDRRIAGNMKAEKYTKVAKKMGKLISCFPYVRGVYISGSLSKGCVDDKGDIDFFIVTSPGRLWLARTLMILFKKIFLFNSHKYFCPNYFIDTDHLAIEEKNIFTAKELSYLFPLYNQNIYNKMLEVNIWRTEYLPNFPIRKGGYPLNSIWLKDAVEFIFNSKLGSVLDTFCMKITESFWRIKHKGKFGAGVNIRCTKHVSKFHPRGYQNKIIEAYKEKIRDFEKINNIAIS